MCLDRFVKRPFSSTLICSLSLAGMTAPLMHQKCELELFRWTDVLSQVLQSNSVRLELTKSV